jgi:hypothetical protein
LNWGRCCCFQANIVELPGISLARPYQVETASSVVDDGNGDGFKDVLKAKNHKAKNHKAKNPQSKKSTKQKIHKAKNPDLGAFCGKQDSWAR